MSFETLSMKDAFMKYIPLKFKISYSPISMLPFIQQKKGNANMLNYWEIIIVTILCELKVSWTGITAKSTEWFISNRSIKWFLTIPGFGTCIFIVGAVWIITPVGVTGPCTGEYILFCSSCSITDEGSGISVISYRPAYQKKTIKLHKLFI